MQSNPWTWIAEPGPRTTHCTLVVHGLNNRPETMDALGQQLGGSNHAVLRVNLRGHHNPRETKYLSSAEGWLEDFAGALTEASSRLGGKDINIIAFSMGGTITLHHLLDNPNAKVGSLLLLAPAIRLTPQCSAGSFVKWFGSIRASIPSLAPASHRAFRCTPFRAYKALFELIDGVNRPEAAQRLRELSVHIVMDERDELVSAVRTARWMQELSLNSWSLEYIRPEYGLSRHKHHLIIDNTCVDQKTWDTLCSILADKVVS